MSEQLVYRCEWKKDYRGVYVEMHSSKKSTADHKKWVWYESLEKAKAAEASRMSRLAHLLMQEADSLLADERGR